MKNVSVLFTLLFFFSSCSGVKNASEQQMVSDTIRVINEAKFIQNYMQYRTEVMDKGKDVKRMLAEDKISGSQYTELQNAYQTTQNSFNSIFGLLVDDLVINMDKMIIDENGYRDKYTAKFKDEIERSKSLDQFLGLYAQYSDKDDSILATLITITGPIILDGIRGFIRNSAKFKAFTAKRLMPPVVNKFGFPDFASL